MNALDVVFDAVLSRASGDGRVAVGLAGAVAVGKTTIATTISDGLTSRGLTVRVLTTDSFLFPNADLAARDLLMRKGFPETYDADAIGDALHRLKRGERVSVPVYSHVTYDIVPGRSDDVDPAHVVLIEGVIALQPSVRTHLDLGVYIDAPEEVVRGWFVERFVRLTQAARDDEGSFYHRFASLDDEQLRQLAAGTWDGINGPNLREHIAPTKDAAHLVITKGSDHAVARVDAV